MAKPDYGYLVNGKIPANTPCPFRAECDQIGTAQCRYLGMPEATAYSCHVAQRLDTAHQKQCRIAAHEARQRAEHAEKLARQDWKQQHKALEAIAPHYRHTMDRFTPAEVLEHLSTTGIPRQYMGDDGQLYRVNMNSARYYTFRDNTHCACCGLEGTYFLLQDNQTRPGRPVVSGHFNLYGDDPVLGPVLFTKDHIIPVSRGGENILSNYRTMCAVCNQLRGNHDTVPFNIILEARDGVKAQGMAASVTYIDHWAAVHGEVPTQGQCPPRVQHKVRACDLEGVLA